MAYPAEALTEITMVQTYPGSQILNVFTYWADNVPGTVDAVHIAEAWWNAVKTTWRAMIAVGIGAYFQSVRIQELNNSAGAFAEWNVPVGEQVGTRAAPAAPQVLPLFNAAAVRLTVGTRLTRPGQKRFFGLTETDNDGGPIGSAFLTLLNAHMAVLDSQITLGAPAALVTLDPIVTSRDAAGTVINYQNVTGYVINPNISSQNTRKPGRGI